MRYLSLSTGLNNAWLPRLARDDDIPSLNRLIPISVRKLQATHYSSAQMDGALGLVFAVDRQLICDGTYYVVEDGGEIIGCGGWSKRRSLYGGDSRRQEQDLELDPCSDAARIRAFFVHPDRARLGIGASIMRACEDAILHAGFRDVKIVATLAGEPLYCSFGYTVTERSAIPLPGGLSLPVVHLAKRFDVRNECS